jgi:3-oxoacyl-[acyl-carrier protein] reductase
MLEISLKDRVSLITGGARGIGKSIAEKLAQADCKVIIADIMKEEAEKTAEEIKNKYKNETFAVEINVADINSVEKAVNLSLDKFGKIDILVNNAGVTRDNLLLRMSPDDWDFVLNINLKGMFNVTKVVVPNMMKNKYGRIINIASIVGIIGNIGQANYSASKGGAIAFTKTIAKEFASRNINCNAIAPGFIDTDMTRKLPENIKQEWIKLIPQKKYGTPEDVANAVLFLSSELSSYITGQVIVVDGGLVM